MPIRELDDDTVRQIAAGEVVERPASAVKELVENSLDAGATRIDVAVERGGTERIRVADDGVGMTREEVERAVEEHTTSKIEGIDDLASGVGTLGFRGEALHAIGAVSRMTITTKPQGGERATELVVDHGEVVEVGPAGRPEGTTVEVTDLFGETPARRKFLKADATEFDHVNRVVTRYALAEPDVAVSLLHDDREVFATTGQGDLGAAVLSVYGREVAEAMIAVDGEGVSGYVSHPETTRSAREHLATYVNGRFVASNTLRNAIIDAYGDQLAPDRYPFAVVFVEVDPGAVDVNVHPRKLEVRFDDEAAVRERVREAVEGALLDHGLVRTAAPRGRSAPDEAEVAPEPPDGGEEASDGPEGTAADGTADAAPETTGDRSRSTAPPDDATPDTADPSTAEADARATTSDDANRRFRGGGTQETLDTGTGAEEEAFDRLPSMRVLGQLHDTYLVAETDDGLVLIDQHAADERVNYERLCDRVADDPGTQALAEPVELELTAREAALFPEYADALAEVGFRATLVDDRTVAVRAVPAVVDDALDPELLRDVLGEFVAGVGDTSVDDRADALLADLACHPSITGGTSLTEGSTTALLAALDDCENPYACPHGRPTIVELSEAELAERFERDYPGHGGRRAE